MLRVLLLGVFDIFDYIADSLQFLGLLVGNLVAKLLFQRHDQLDRIERISAQILDELGVRCHLIGVDAQLLDDDFLNSLFDAFISHGVSVIFRGSLCHAPRPVKPRFVIRGPFT